MAHKKSIANFLGVILISLMLTLVSCNTGSPSPQTTNDCFQGLTDSQQKIIKQFIELLKDTTKISAKSAIGFPSGFMEKDTKSFTSANTMSNYTQGYLSDFFHVLDLTEFPVTDATTMYNKYVAEKCRDMEMSFPSVDGKETKSILISIDSLHKLEDQLWSYQNQTHRKTGVRVVFANYADDMSTGSKKAGKLTFFMVGTVDTLATPSSAFNWQFQKDLTIVGAGSGLSIPAWGLAAYNHGELCPNSCAVSGSNTNYH